MGEGVLGWAVTTSPGKHIEEHVNTSEATTAFDPPPLAAFLFIFCQIIGPQFMSEAFNCSRFQRATQAASRFPHQLRHLLLPDFFKHDWRGFNDIYTFVRKSASEKKGRRKKVFVSFSPCSCIHPRHSGCCSATKAHCLKCHIPQPSLSRRLRCQMHECVSGRKWNKGAGHSLSRHFHVNKGLLHCTSARYPPFLFFSANLPFTPLTLHYCLNGVTRFQDQNIKQLGGPPFTKCLFVFLTVEGHDLSKH